MAKFYLLLTVLGTLIPYGAFLPWLIENGFNLALMWSEIADNPLSAFAWLDVVLSAVALMGFIIVDGKKHAVKYRYCALLATVCVGVSSGLPMYLYLRAKQVA